MVVEIDKQRDRLGKFTVVNRSRTTEEKLPVLNEKMPRLKGNRFITFINFDGARDTPLIPSPILTQSCCQKIVEGTTAIPSVPWLRKAPAIRYVQNALKFFQARFHFTRLLQTARQSGRI